MILLDFDVSLLQIVEILQQKTVDSVANLVVFESKKGQQSQIVCHLYLLPLLPGVKLS